LKNFFTRTLNKFEGVIYNEKNPSLGLVRGGREYADCGRKHEVYTKDIATGKLKQVYDCTGDYCTGDDVCIANLCLNAVVYGIKA